MLFYPRAVIILCALSEQESSVSARKLGAEAVGNSFQEFHNTGSGWVKGGEVEKIKENISPQKLVQPAKTG